MERTTLTPKELSDLRRFEEQYQDIKADKTKTHFYVDTVKEAEFLVATDLADEEMLALGLTPADILELAWNRLDVPEIAGGGIVYWS